MAEVSPYVCMECGEKFVPIPDDPMASQGAYLDHVAEHDAALDAELAAISESVAAADAAENEVPD